jgi:hypothetical protein
MPRTIIPLLAAFAMTALAPLSAMAVENCRTGDSAICLSDPNCHWDFERRGCYEGAPPKQDACAAHSHPETCNADHTLGCTWNTESNQCRSAN